MVLIYNNIISLIIIIRKTSKIGKESVYTKRKGLDSEAISSDLKELLKHFALVHLDLITND